jgi:hypothetical protein
MSVRSFMISLLSPGSQNDRLNLVVIHTTRRSFFTYFGVPPFRSGEALEDGRSSSLGGAINGH